MTTPTPKDAVPFDPPVFCSGIERDCKHGQLARSCHICELERDLAAAKDTISKYHERIISQHAQIDDLKWSLWKIEGKHKAAILEVITKLAAAQEARQRAEEQVLSRIIGIATVGDIDGHEVIRRQSAIDVVRMVFAAIDSAREALK